MAPADPPAAASCRPIPKGKIQDSHSEQVHVSAENFCSTYAASISYDPSVNIEYILHNDILSAFFSHNDREDDVYDMFIKSIADCKPDGGYNLPEPVKGHSCKDILYSAWSECEFMHVHIQPPFFFDIYLGVLFLSLIFSFFSFS